MLITKRWLADNEILQIFALVPEATAAEMRRGIQRPTGVAARRVISDKVKGRIRREARACLNHGDISQSAHDYLTAWAFGSLVKRPKPAMYSFLNHSWKQDGVLNMNAGIYVPPARKRIFDLDPGAIDSGESSAEDNPDPITDEA